IGAGSSGIAAAKALHERGIPCDCFEKSDRVGGNWVFGNKNGLSAAYRSLHINTSRERMAYSDYPMPAHYPDFPHHAQIAAYVDSAGFAGKRVVVLGMGNSAMDIAVEASYAAEQVYLAARRGAHVIPKYLFGNPLDQQGAWDPSVPFHVRQRRFEEALLRTV